MLGDKKGEGGKAILGKVAEAALVTDEEGSQLREGRRLHW